MKKHRGVPVHINDAIPTALERKAFPSKKSMSAIIIFSHNSIYILGFVSKCSQAKPLYTTCNIPSCRTPFLKFQFRFGVKPTLAINERKVSLFD